MTEDTRPKPADEPKTETRGRPPKGVQIRNDSARPITLIGTNKPADRVTVLPTETVEVDGKLWAVLEKNKAAMTFFDERQLVKV